MASRHGLLGILGGMGPMATVDFMGKVVRATPATRDQDHIPMIVCSATKIPDRTAAILGEGPDPLPAMQASLRQLEGAGATCIAIPCNTAHHWHAALQAGTTVRVLHIVDAVAEILLRDGAARRGVGLLATRGSLAAGIYRQGLARHGLACHVPDEDGQAQVSEAIALVKAGRLETARTILHAEADALLRGGCEKIVMACSEIPLALAAARGDLGDKLVDATEALAQACVTACVGGDLARDRLAA